MTKIEWTEKTWNPVTGCTKVSEACQNCYAAVMANRLSGMPGSREKYKARFKLTLHPEVLGEPYHWKKSRMVFVCSMGDLFHEDVPVSFISKVIQVIRENPRHTFQILTKRAQRMSSFFNMYKVPENAWIGVTCESPIHYDRVDYLRAIPQNCIKFLSCEPLLGDMGDIDLTDIDWVICGGESGVKARRTPVEWFRNLRDRCIEKDTAFFFKQWGAYGPDGSKSSKEANGKTLDGREWKEYPNAKHAGVNEFLNMQN